MGVLEGANLTEFALVGLVSTRRPRPCHVDESHAFEHEEATVARTSELAVENLANRAGFANEVRPVGDLGELETGAPLTTRRKRGAHGDTRGVVAGLTRTEAVEARTPEGALNHVLTEIKRLQAARA